LPAGGGGNEVEFIASGTLPNGKPVILKANGQVEVVAATSTNISQSIPAASATSNGYGLAIDFPQISFDPNVSGRFIIAYRDSGANFSINVGTINGTSISFGTRVIISSSEHQWTAIAFDPSEAGKFVACFQDNTSSSILSGVVGTVSGTSVSLSAKTTLINYNISNIRISFDKVTAGKFILSYKRASNNYGTVASVIRSGDSFTVGTTVTTNNGQTLFQEVECDPHNADKFAVVYRDYPNSQRGTIQIGTVSGQNITIGSKIVFQSNAISDSHVAFDPNVANKIVLAFCNNSDGNKGYVKIGTISGTSVSFGSNVIFNTGNTSGDSFLEVHMDKKTPNSFLIAYKDTGNGNKGTAVVGTISNATISLGSEIVFYNATIYKGDMAVNPNEYGRFVVFFNDSYGKAIPLQMATTIVTTNVTASNFLGTSTAAYTNGQTAKIMLQGGISTNQSSLAIGSTYYIQKNGTLATTADEPSVIAGKAVKATTLLLKGI